MAFPFISEARAEPVDLSTDISTIIDPRLRYDGSLGEVVYAAQLDKFGRLLYSCKNDGCPDKWCKNMACKFKSDIATSDMTAICECTETK